MQPVEHIANVFSWRERRLTDHGQPGLESNLFHELEVGLAVKSCPASFLEQDGGNLFPRKAAAKLATLSERRGRGIL